MGPITPQNNIEHLINHCQLKISLLEGNDANHRKKIVMIWEKLLKLMENQPPLATRDERIIIKLAFWETTKKENIQRLFGELKTELEQICLPKGYLSSFTKLERACFGVFQSTALSKAKEAKIQGIDNTLLSPLSTTAGEWNVLEWLERPLIARL